VVGQGRLVSASSLDWGDVPAWVGALLTGGSVLFAAFTLRSSARTSERAQASQVHVVVDREVGPGKESSGDPGHGKPTMTFRLTVRNDSDGPIYEVSYGLTPAFNRPAVPDDRAHVVYLDPHSATPALVRTITYPSDVGLWHLLPSGRASFADANGLDWERLSDGSLRRRRTASRRWLKLQLHLARTKPGLQRWLNTKVRRAGPKPRRR
jgi:hypothetical protein